MGTDIGFFGVLFGIRAFVLVGVGRKKKKLTIGWTFYKSIIIMDGGEMATLGSSTVIFRP